MSIVIKGVTSRKTEVDDRRFTYKDVALDFSVGRTPRDPALYSAEVKQDLVDIFDETAIKNSIATLFKTRKGQKAIEPEYGLNIEDYLFTNITPEYAQLIGEDIVSTISRWEPRLSLAQVNVIPNIDDNRYDIVLNIIVPSFKRSMYFTGTFENSSFTLIN